MWRPNFSWGGFPGSLAVPLIAIAVTVWLLSLDLSLSLHGYGPTALKAYHPFFMILGVTLLMPLALIASRVDFGPLGNSFFGSRAARRKLHAALAASAAVCIFVGFIIHFYLNQSTGTAHLPISEPAKHSPAARTVHVIIGYAVVGAVLLQVAGGALKLMRSPLKFLHLHGYLGLATFVAGCTCIVIAAYFEYMEYEYQPAGTTWTLGEAIAVVVAIVLLLAAVFGFRALASSAHVIDDDAQLLEENTYDDLGADLK